MAPRQGAPVEPTQENLKHGRLTLTHSLASLEPHMDVSSLPPEVRFRLSPEGRGVWQHELWRRIAPRRAELAELVAAALPPGSVPLLPPRGADAPSLSGTIAIYLEDFAQGREEGLRFFLGAGAEVARTALAQALGLEMGQFEIWLEHALRTAPLPRLPIPGEETPQEPPLPEVPASTEHRSEEATAWIEQRIAAGLEKLSGEEPRLRKALESEARGILRGLVLDGLRRGLGPTDVLVSPSQWVERELARLGPMAVRLGPEGSERRRRLGLLLGHVGRLCREAGWLIERGSHWHLAEPLLGVLLAGEALTEVDGDRSVLRRLLGQHRGWAEAAWWAVSRGDDPVAWARLLVEEEDPVWIVERAIVTSAALGSVAGPVPEAAVLGEALRVLVATLIAFFPRGDDARLAPEGRVDTVSPWYVPAEAFRRMALDLAHASVWMGTLLGGVIDERLWRELAGRVGSIVRALGLPDRLGEDEKRAVAVLCVPFQAADRGWMDEAFFRALFRFWRVGLAFGDEAKERWMDRFGVPALYRLKEDEALLWLVDPERGGPAGYLLNRPALVKHWSAAWERLLQRVEPDKAAQWWVLAIMRLPTHGQPNDEAVHLLLEEVPERLQAAGLWPVAVQRLRAAFEQPPRAVTTTEGEIQLLAAILRLAGFSAVEWETQIKMWTDQPALPWRAILEAGAPHAAVARWCVHKLKAREEAPPAYRDGPVGILASSGVQLLSNDAWQLAFQQSREALAWLFNHGDEAGLLVLAEACLAQPPTEPVRDISLGKIPGINLDLVLSQGLWGLVLHRRAGRAAFFTRIERGEWLGHIHLVPGSALPGSVSILWQHIALPLMLVALGEKPPVMPELMDAAEANRALSCFERWLANERESMWLGEDPLALQALMLALVALFGADIAMQWHGLLSVAIARPTLSPTMGTLDNLMAQSVGFALGGLLAHHVNVRESLASYVLSPEVLGWMRREGTFYFWLALVLNYGSEQVLAALATLGGRDAGRDLVVVLLQRDRSALERHQLRPELRRGILFLAAQGQYAPAEPFWAVAWQTPPEDDLLADLVQLAPGRWFEELLRHAVAWPHEAQNTVLGTLAAYSSSPEVRRRCLAMLLPADPTQPALDTMRPPHDSH